MCAINMAEFQIYGSLAAFFAPLVIMFVMYTLTIRTLKQQARLVSNIMVQNSPPRSVSRTSQNRSFYNSIRRKESRQPTEFLKDSSRVPNIHYHGRIAKDEKDDDVFGSDMQLDVSKTLKDKCARCQNKTTPPQESTWRKAVRMIANFFRRIQGKSKRSNSATTMNTLNNNDIR